MNTLKLDVATQMLYADFTLKVASRDFDYAGIPLMPLETTSKYKGIAYRYIDTINGTTDSVEIVDLQISFQVKNDFGWIVGDKVRIMGLNENTQNEFLGLRDYFLERLDEFQDLPSVLDDVLQAFNDGWNHRHRTEPLLQVGHYVVPKKSLKNERSLESGRLPELNQLPKLAKASEFAYEAPRFTKKDILLSITAR